MTIDSAPGRDVTQSAGIGAGDDELIARLQLPDPILSSDDRQWAEKISSVQLVVAVTHFNTVVGPLAS